jgi:hypothetical protein
VLWLVVKVQTRVLAKKKFPLLNQKKRVVAIAIILKRKITKDVKAIAAILNVDVLQRARLLR